MRKALNLIPGGALGAIFMGILLWGIPMLHLALTGELLGFGG